MERTNGKPGRNGRSLIRVAAFGVLLTAVMLAPVTAAVKPATKKQVKGVSKRVKALEKTFYRKGGPFTVPDSSFAFGEVACPSGTEATGGGGFMSGPNITMHASMPTDGTGVWTSSTGDSGAGFAGWGVIGVDQFGGGGSFTVYVICQTAKTVDSNYPSGSVARSKTTWNE